MSCHNKFPIVSVLTGILIFFIVMTFWFGKKVRDNYFEQKEKERVVLLQKHELKNKIHYWVYNNYTQVSREMIDDVLDEVFKTDHPLLILSIVGAESDFIPTAHSKAGAMGLGQINPKTYLVILKNKGIIKEKRDLYNIKENIKATEYAIKYEIAFTKGDIYKALVRYSGGANKYTWKVLTNFVYLSMIKQETETKYAKNNI